jgi:hypothetical protein
VAGRLGLGEGSSAEGRSGEKGRGSDTKSRPGMSYIPMNLIQSGARTTRRGRHGEQGLDRGWNHAGVYSRLLCGVTKPRARKGTRGLRAGRHRIPDTVYSSNLNERGSPAQDAPHLCGPMITITRWTSTIVVVFLGWMLRRKRRAGSVGQGWLDSVRVAGGRARRGAAFVCVHQAAVKTSARSPRLSDIRFRGSLLPGWIHVQQQANRELRGSPFCWSEDFRGSHWPRRNAHVAEHKISS